LRQEDKGMVLLYQKMYVPKWLWFLEEIGVEPKSIGEMEKGQRNEILKKLKSKYSIRQLERVTGVSRGVIHKC